MFVRIRRHRRLRVRARRIPAAPDLGQSYSA